MNLAVLFWGQLPQEQRIAGIPDAWPAQVIEIGKETKLDGYTVMSLEEYKQYVKEQRPKYDEYVAANPKQEPELEIERLKRRVAPIEARVQ